MRSNPDVVVFTVRRNGETEEYAREYYADDPRNAATQAAAHDHAHRCGWEWKWPVEYLVKDPTGKEYLVEVERETIPEFVAGKPKVIA